MNKKPNKKSRLIAKTGLILALATFGVFLASIQAAEVDPFALYLDGKAPEILREIPNTQPVPVSVTLRQVVFRSRDDSEIYAVIATPKTPGKHPGLLVLHGGGGCAEVDKALAWAQRGYVAVAPDLPGIADPKKMTVSKGKWRGWKYGEQRFVANPDASASVLFDAVLSAMKSLYLLRAQSDVDLANVGVVGISWGGYMTTMVCGLAGEKVKAGFAIYGCGFFDKGGYADTLFEKLPAEEKARWLAQLDAGRRAPQMKAAYFLAAASDDFFGWIRAAQATLDAIPGEKNHAIAPNANHKSPYHGGSTYDVNPPKNFTPTPFQPMPTAAGNHSNWLAMEVPYFEYYLKGLGKPFPKVLVAPGADLHTARFSINAPCPITKAEVYWAPATPAVMKKDDEIKRVWTAVSAAKNGEAYEANLPAEAYEWFALVSDDRPVTVSSDLTSVAPGRSGN